VKIVGIRFRDNWKVYDFEDAGVDAVVGDKVIVDSDRGLGLGHVVRIRRAKRSAVTEPLPEPVPAPEELEIEIDIDEDKDKTASGANSSQAQTPKTLRKVMRKATNEDIAQEEKNRSREHDAFKTAQDMITERDMPMKLIRVEFSFDASRTTFFFFSETRVDFRELVKDLAHKLRSRIEMRQIGVRDVARLIGGFGPCGRELCCASFLKNFEPVSIRMAKKQEMVLNPAKISGVCGRLLCCLSYEYGMYDENKKDLANMRETVAKGKKEEETRRVEDEQRVVEERRLEEEKRRQEERRQQDQRRDNQKEKNQKHVPRQGPSPEANRNNQQEKKAQPAPEQRREQQPKQKQEPQQPQVQTGQQPQQAEDKSGRKKRRRFWRKKKKGQQGENKPQKPEG